MRSLRLGIASVVLAVLLVVAGVSVLDTGPNIDEYPDNWNKTGMTDYKTHMETLEAKFSNTSYTMKEVTIVKSEGGREKFVTVTRYDGEEMRVNQSLFNTSKKLPDSDGPDYTVTGLSTYMSSDCYASKYQLVNGTNKYSQSSVLSGRFIPAPGSIPSFRMFDPDIEYRASGVETFRGQTVINYTATGYEYQSDEYQLKSGYLLVRKSDGVILKSVVSIDEGEQTEIEKHVLTNVSESSVEQPEWVASNTNC